LIGANFISNCFVCDCWVLNSHMALIKAVPITFLSYSCHIPITFPSRSHHIPSYHVPITFKSCSNHVVSCYYHVPLKFLSNSYHVPIMTLCLSSSYFMILSFSMNWSFKVDLIQSSIKSRANRLLYSIAVWPMYTVTVQTAYAVRSKYGREGERGRKEGQRCD